MTAPTQVQTAGPVDPNAPTRVKVWAGLAVLTPLIAALATFGILSDGQASAINSALTAVIGLLSAFGFGFVAKKTNEQVKNGTFDAPPPPQIVVAPSPVENAFQSVNDLKSHLDAAVEDAVSKVKAGTAIMQGAISLLPGGVTPAGAVADLLNSLDQP